ncbi:predicted protein [Uncinocarpus reesii 1704]|uniref:Aminoglycoside phosphotransferase domain-containing protein n=1 Tax=Uncinocarpus reesii (strain UAMH 1704) TaxID=336963 RepID=C4JTT3_UNCRE|nr:uncharacterized protein UREG_05872 [Uncinocarpus reesii 1704]EEP81030.1 predicted protein [Uncinocarpus reesii 1704]
MDQLKKYQLDEAAKAFIAAIDRDRVCSLASSFHRESWPCRIFGDVSKGGYNACFPIVFITPEGNKADRWMVRVPLIPRLAFPEEKMRSEITTMKYISEKIKIPVPRIYGYSMQGNNILGLPFLLLEYIEGKSLLTIRLNQLSIDEQEHLYPQLSERYLELSQQQKSDRIGALTLDQNDDKWVFSHNRPLSIFVNGQVLGGLDACRHMGPS